MAPSTPPLSQDLTPTQAALAVSASGVAPTTEVVVASAADASVRRWLIASAIVVVITLVVGGITRLTESGLSITEWNPVSGVLPPLSAADWEAAFQSYLQIPEAQTVHQGITLAQFKTLFWWEWLHRIAARLAGVVITIPFFVLLARGRVRREMRGWLLLLPILTAGQGALGWYMVTSGLSGRTDVSQYRLVAHLGLALVIFVLAVWGALMLTPRKAVAAPNVRPRIERYTMPLWVLSVLVFVTILSGGFVAGLDAGHIFNTFPLMDGRVVPPGYGQLGGFWTNAFENPAAVQFNHRVLAIGTVLFALALWWSVRRSEVTGLLASRMRLVAIAAVVQVTLGILTLLFAVPIPVAALHQLGAVALLTASMMALHEARQKQGIGNGE